MVCVIVMTYSCFNMMITKSPPDMHLWLFLLMFSLYVLIRLAENEKRTKKMVA